MKNIKHIGLLFILLTVFFACQEEEAVYPKPISGMKITFPDRDYSNIVKGCKYSFKTPTYVQVDTAAGKCNLNINLKPFNATLFLTYIPIDTSLMYHIEYSRKLVYDHSIKASSIEEKRILNPENNTYGLAYKLIGDAASPFQFYVTDSLNHFLRGALYFNSKPNYDSLQPTIEHLLVEFDTLFSTLNWVDSFDE